MFLLYAIPRSNEVQIIVAIYNANGQMTFGYNIIL